MKTKKSIILSALPTEKKIELFDAILITELERMSSISTETSLGEESPENEKFIDDLLLELEVLHEICNDVEMSPHEKVELLRLARAEGKRALIRHIDDTAKAVNTAE